MDPLRSRPRRWGAHHLAACMGGGVHHQVGTRSDPIEQSPEDLLQALEHRRVLRLRVVVHPRDRGAREDVVELLGQHSLPEPVELYGLG
ncbi:MAG: hypothetical protein M5U19_09245 [Microthrixaceae bacterium]|nr:hypothetical protein [Microthrixaceae bacterium]